MGLLRNMDTGQEIFVSDERAAQLLGEPGWTAADPNELINVEEGTVRAGDIAGSGIGAATGRVVSRDEATEKGLEDLSRRAFEDDDLESFGLGVARGATLGLSDVGARIAGADPEYLRAMQEYNPYASIGGELVGAVATGGRGLAGSVLVRTPAAFANRAAARLAGNSVVARGAIEGALHGAGAGLSQVALSDDPADLDRAASTIGSSMLFGGAVGGGAGLLAKAAQKGLARASRRLDDIKAGKASNVADDAGRVVDDVPDELANLDHAGLKAAREIEVERIASGRQAEALAMPDELLAYGRAVDDVASDGLWGVLKDAPKGTNRRGLLARFTRMHGSKGNFNRTLERSRRAIERNPLAARRVIEESDQIVADLAEEIPEMAESLKGLLAKNQAIRSKIDDIAIPKRDFVSPRLSQIESAQAALITPKAAPKGFLENAARTITFGAATAATAPIAGIGAPFIGKSVADFVGDVVGGRLAKAGAASQERAVQALKTFLGAADKALRPAPIIASKILTQARFGPEEKKPHPEPFRAREKEIQDQVMQTPAGIKMTMPARQAMARRLDPIRMLSPVVADRLESHAATRLEFLANKLPKRHGMGVPIGPDRWSPSDFEVAKFARYVAAVEDPNGVLERMSDGSMTPEDVEVMREVYPGMYAELQTQLLGELPHLRETLPYAKRLMLSIFFGVPVDPAMEPNILAALQANFAREPGTEGGTQAPAPQPAFGTITNNEATPSQERTG